MATCTAHSRCGGGCACDCRGASRRAGRRCEHDRRDDRSVRDGLASGWRRRGQRGDGSASRVSTAVNDVSRDLILGALALEPDPARRRRLTPVAGAHARQQRRGRARSDRDPCALRPTAVSGAMSSRIVRSGGGRYLWISRQPCRHRCPAPRHRRCSTRGSDRRSRRRPAASQRFDRGSLLVAVRDVEQLHHVGRVVALAVQGLRDFRCRCASCSRETTAAGTTRPRAARWSRSDSACVCLPLWSSPSKAIRVPRVIRSRAPACRRSSGGGE